MEAHHLPQVGFSFTVLVQSLLLNYTVLVFTDYSTYNFVLAVRRHTVVVAVPIQTGFHQVERLHFQNHRLAFFHQACCSQ